MATVFRPGATALISGSASGVGFAFAQICRRHGMNLALLDRDTTNLAKAKAELQSMSSSGTTRAEMKTESYEIDVADLSAWTRIRDQVSAEFPSIDLLMLNAGAAPKPDPSKQNWEDVSYFHKTLDTNLFGPINGIATFLGDVQKSPGPSAIILTGSKQGITNPPGNPAYNASKSALKTLAEHLAHDLRTSSTASHAPHVSVHLLIPGWTYTGLSGNAGPVADDKASANKPPGAWLPSQCAEYGFQGILKGNFYLVCPDNDVDESLDQARMSWGAADWVEGRSALSRWDGEWKDRAAEWIAAEAERRRGGGGGGKK